MNNVEFIDAIKIVVKNNATDDLKQLLENPPGRSPDKNLVDLSNWYNDLSSIDKTNLIRTVEVAVNTLNPQA